MSSATKRPCWLAERPAIRRCSRPRQQAASQWFSPYFNTHPPIPLPISRFFSSHFSIRQNQSGSRAAPSVRKPAHLLCAAQNPPWEPNSSFPNRSRHSEAIASASYAASLTNRAVVPSIPASEPAVPTPIQLLCFPGPTPPTTDLAPTGVA